MAYPTTIEPSDHLPVLHDSHLPFGNALAPPPHARRRMLSKERMVALSEGVFAVVMTLMLLSVIDEIDSPSFDVDRLGATLVGLWPKFTAFFISFFIVEVLPWFGAIFIVSSVLRGQWRMHLLLLHTFCGGIHSGYTVFD